MYKIPIERLKSKICRKKWLKDCRNKKTFSDRTSLDDVITNHQASKAEGKKKLLDGQIAYSCFCILGIILDICALAINGVLYRN